MATERNYSTREVAQMWNVSESTVKRWADSFGLKCFRTPGGHRRFRLEEISEFQQNRAFEATGLLSTENWENPDLEIWLNSRNFSKVVDLLLYLASQNQKPEITCLLERLYLRGMRLEEIYDLVISPFEALVSRNRAEGSLIEGHVLLARTCLEETLIHFAKKMIRKRRNGKTALCATPSESSTLAVRIMTQVLEIEGWECLNLGDSVSFSTMSEMVEAEPINLVSIFAAEKNGLPKVQGYEKLNSITHSYRIPVLVTSVQKLQADCFANLDCEKRFSDFRSLRDYVSKALT